MATQFDPIAKDESLNTTETPSRNIADVLAQGLAAVVGAMPATELANLSDVTISVPSNGQTLKYNSITQKWENANDAGGHVIEEQDGTDMTQRANLQFVDAHLTDDSVNDRTEVENIKDITAADYASATEDGFYNVTDESDEELTAADIAYDSNDSIKEKINDLDAAVKRGSVSVTADGVETFATLIGRLYTSCEYGKVNTNSSIDYNSSGDVSHFTVSKYSTTRSYFSHIDIETKVQTTNIKLASSATFTTATTSGTTDNSSAVPLAGLTLTLNY